MQMSQFSQMSPGSMPSSGLRDKKRGNRKLTKADISMPTDFKHVVHVGWTAQKGFDLNGEEVDNLNHFLERAGVSEQQLNDRETRAFIYDFIQSNNVLDSVKLENSSDQSSRHAPPPVPSRIHVSYLDFFLMCSKFAWFRRMEHNGLHRLHLQLILLNNVNHYRLCLKPSLIVLRHLVVHHR